MRRLMVVVVIGPKNKKMNRKERKETAAKIREENSLRAFAASLRSLRLSCG